MHSWTDTHAHVYHPDLATDVVGIMARSRAAGVKRVFMPNVDVESIDRMLAMETQFPGECIAMMGIHPCSIKADFEKELAHAESWLNRRKFAAIGEIGTDLYWDKSHWAEQQEAFRIQVGWAKKFKLPIVIHCRQSIDETIALLAPLADASLTGIFHCFSGNAVQARQILEMGFYLGIGGVATFKNGGMDKVLPATGIGKLVLETDSPYLAPVPHRGKRNEPAYIPLIASKVMELTGCSEAALSAATEGNARFIFG